MAARAVKRPVLAALVMACVVRLVLPDWSSVMSTTESLAWLISGMFLGMTTYAAAVWLLWFGAGYPQGAERVLIEQLRERLAQRRDVSAPTVL